MDAHLSLTENYSFNLNLSFKKKKRHYCLFTLNVPSFPEWDFGQMREEGEDSDKEAANPQRSGKKEGEGRGRVRRESRSSTLGEASVFCQFCAGGSLPGIGTGCLPW